MSTQIISSPEGLAQAIQFITNSKRPVLNEQDLVINSILDKREWARLDAAVITMAKLRLVGIGDLRAANLVSSTTLAEMVRQWRVAAERVRPSVNMDGRTQAGKDRIDKKTYGVPVPIIRADYEIGRRELLASRAVGADIDTSEAGEAGAAVAEEAERILFNGNTDTVVNGNALYGYTTLPARTTNTAAGFGGGDFGTISNIKPTFTGMLTALSAKRYHGPFGCYIANTQYHQMLENYTDGSGQTALDRVLALPQISFVKPSDMLVDGALTMVQMTANVVELIEALVLENREWESGDGQSLNYAVMTAMAPKLVTDYAGNAGVAHATAC
jgi:hypothetical protein